MPSSKRERRGTKMEIWCDFHNIKLKSERMARSLHKPYVGEVSLGRILKVGFALSK